MILDISVVIPAFNRARQLPACLDSVLSQTLMPREIIVIDDGSTDDTHQVAMSYVSQGVRCFRNEKSGGAQAARNIGICNARHDWIAFQDSDDIWMQDKLESQVAALSGRAVMENFVVHCNGMKEVTEENRIEKIPMMTFAGNCHAQTLLYPGPMFQGLLVHKSKLLAIGLLDEHCPAYQEWDTAIRLAKAAEFIHIEKPLFHWRWHDEATMSKSLTRDFVGFQYVIEKHRHEILEVHGRRTWSKLLARSLSRGLQFGTFPQVINSVRAQTPYLPNLLAGSLAKLGTCPPGTALAMKIAGFLAI